MEKRKNPLKTFLKIIIFLFQIIPLTKCQQATSYTIYHTGKTFPRPLLIETSSPTNPSNHDVLALSGTRSTDSGSENAFLSRYNSKGEKISSDENGIDLNFKYEVNACIRQFSDNTYVVASGAGDLDIVLFDDNGKIQESRFSTTSTITIEVVSYKIDIFVTHDDKLIVGYCSGKENCPEGNKYCKQIRIQKYILGDENYFSPYGTLWTHNSDNRYISCVEMGASYEYKIACLYVSGDCKEQVTLFSNDLVNVKQDWLMEQAPDSSRSCPFDKIIKLSDQYAVATYQIKNTMKYSVIKVFSDTDYSSDAMEHSTKRFYKFVLYQQEALTGCVENTNRVDTAKWDEKSFVFTCVNNDNSNANHFIRVKIIYINEYGEKTGDKYFESINGYADYPFISRFGSTFMSIFYHFEGNRKSDNVFEIVGYPACSDVSVTDIFINSHTDEFSLEPYVTKGTGELAFSGVSDSENIHIYFPEAYSSGEMKLSTGESIIAGGSQTYDSKNKLFVYYSDFVYTKVNIKFQPVRGGLYGRYCWISFEVKDCYLGCYTCQQTSNDPDNQKCSSCAEVNYYYQKGDIFSDHTMNCLNEADSEGYYKDGSGIYRECNVTCKTCVEPGTSTNANCLTCKDGFLKLEVESRVDDKTNCYQYPSSGKSCPEGYFYTYEEDPDDSNIKINEKCGKCYNKCSACVKYGVEEKMNCEKCIDNYYFKSDDSNHNCYTGEQISYFIDDSSDVNGKIYKPCDPACKSCNGAKITTTPTSTNCIECNYENNYYPVDDDDDERTNCLQPLTGTSDSSPIENYYLNKPTLSDKSTYSWKKCFRTCKYCTQSPPEGDNENHYCIEFKCITGTYPSFDKRTNCYEEDIKDKGYYLGKTPSVIEDPSETNPEKDIYLKCFSSCKKCSRGGDNNLNNCEECIDNYYPKENIEGSCALDPPTYYLSDNVYKKCYHTCQTCDSAGTESDNKCLSCIEGVTNIIPMGSYYNCIQNCPVGFYFPKDSPTETSCKECDAHKEFVEDVIYCINCNNYGKYHIIGEHNCIDASDVDDPNGDKINYYKENDGYGTITPCDTSCRTCSNAPATKINDDGISIETKNCLSCDNTHYLLDGNCLDDCEEWYVKKDNKCINCKKEKDDHDREMYKYKSSTIEQCVTLEEIPDNPRVIDSNFNYVDDSSCIDPCETCLDSDNTKCLTCISGYYAQYDTLNNEFVTCLETCGQYLVKDVDNRICINCKERVDNLKYFFDRSLYELDPICVDKSNPDYSEYFESTDPNKNPFGVLEKCHNNCKTCSQGSEIIDGNLNMNCDTCKTQYYLDIPPSKNCVSECEEYLGIDDSNPNNKLCINCKEKRLLGMTLYKYIGNNGLYKSDYCITRKPEGTYIDNSDYNTLKDCDISCKTCENSPTSCIECSEGYTFKNINQNICIRTCSTNYWYLDDDGNYKCIDNCNDIENEDRPYQGGKQCVEECTDEKCDYCKINSAYLLYDNLCKFRCPKGYTIDESRTKCIEYIERDDKCVIKMYPSRHSTTISNLKLFAMEWIEEYIFQYNTSLTKHVDILPAHNMTMQLWKDDECELESSLKYHISFVNMSECRKILQEKYTLQKNEILFVKFDINRTSMMNQIHYNAYNAITKAKLNLSYCKSDIIEYSLKESHANYNLVKKIYEKLGADLFNSSDDFFNDNCYHFDDEGKDVTLEERRLYYFQNISLCEKECEYLGTNYTIGTLKCYCKNSLPTLEEASELTEPSLNEGNFKSNIDKSNLGLFKCYNLVFNKDYFVKNKGGFILLILTGIQIPLLLTFTYFSGFKPIYSFLNQFTYLLNPPKKNNNFFIDNSDNQNNNSNNYEILNSNHINKTSTERTLKQISNKYSNSNEKETNLSNANHFFNNSRNENEKIKMKTTNSIHLQNTDNSFKVQSTIKIFKSENNEEKDIDVNQFNDDEKDELDLMNAMKFDDRNFLYMLIRILKKKILFLFPFTYISVFEPFSLKFLVFIFIIGSLFFFNAIFYKKIYVQKRFYEQNSNFGIDYFVKKEIVVSIYSALISFVIQELLHILLSIKKQFVMCIRNIKNKDQFLLKIKNIISCYKKKIIIFIIIDLIGMFTFWYFCSSFYSMYLKTSNAWFYSLIFSFLFIIIIQSVYSFIVCCLRFIGILCGVNLLYKLSQILI